MCRFSGRRCTKRKQNFLPVVYFVVTFSGYTVFVKAIWEIPVEEYA